MSRRRVHFRVSGRVQGVAYRASARDAAMAEGLHGWVRNLDDGDVEGEVEGDPPAVARFLAWCQRGPRSARVDELTVDELAPDDSTTGFHVRR